jgi:rhamnosyltransferase
LFIECDTGSNRQNASVSQTAAVVVLYNPGDEVVVNIRTWNDQVTKVYAIDNSEPPDESFAARLVALENVIYLPQRANLGIAAALNIGAELAISEGFDFLLTMDQDSHAAPGMVAKMINCLGARERIRVGIISPFHAVASDPMPAQTGRKEVLTVMTSGNLLDLAVYRDVGPFLDNLFIDYVDDEYCLRLNAAGYKVVRCNDTELDHNLGNITAHRHRGRNVYIANQNYVRRYYMTRNRFFVIEKYRTRFPDYCVQQLENLRGEIKGIILFEDDKLRKLWMAAKGYLDFRRGRMGRLREA